MRIPSTWAAVEHRKGTCGLQAHKVLMGGTNSGRRRGMFLGSEHATF